MLAPASSEVRHGSILRLQGGYSARLAAAECRLLSDELRALERRAVQLVRALHEHPGRWASPAGPAAGRPGGDRRALRGVTRCTPGIPASAGTVFGPGEGSDEVPALSVDARASLAVHPDGPAIGRELARQTEGRSVTVCYRKADRAVDRVVDREPGAHCAPGAFGNACAAVCAGSEPRAVWPCPS
jgi:hypothetical protein